LYIYGRQEDESLTEGHRSNFPVSTRSCRLHCPMARREVVRFWRPEVCAVWIQDAGNTC
jgi:hypothetical protein